jgi:hypothetical protein
MPHYEGLVAPGKLVTVAESGGKVLLTNHPLDEPTVSASDRRLESTGLLAACLRSEIVSAARKTYRVDLHPIDILRKLNL